MTDKPNDFDVAKAVCEQLQHLDKERQHRIIRWVAESLGIPLPAENISAARSAAEGDIAARVSSGATNAPATDIRTFVEKKRPKSDVQFAAVVAYYYRFEAPVDQRQESISAKVLQDAARLADRSRLKKPNLTLITLNNAKNLGYLDSAGRGTFKINTVGENLVAMTLPSQQEDTQRRTLSRKKRRKRKPKKK
jgi:hypothetical protein